MSFDLTKQRLLSSKERVNRFIDQNIFQWAMETILLPAQSSIEESISFNAAQGLALEKTGFMKVELTWDLTDERGAPIHFYLEEGTGPHTIEAKGKIKGGSDVLHWKSTVGEDMFAVTVEHPGSTKHKGLVHKIEEERRPILIEKIIREVNNHMQVSKI